ncbi:MAG: serine/threonine protein kinase, partial [Myxococcales bacterium]|nr:serine/threonine protein kinase [Myxococcales bacterium]
MAKSPAPPPDGSELLDERYQIIREIGGGGMGRVFEGLHVVLRRKVAIKVLSEQVASDARSRKRLLREARAAAAIGHPNVVETIDFGETADGLVFLVMELLEGRDLRAILREQGCLPWPRAVDLLRQAAGALQAAHDRGIIHRDIKPQNCFVCQVDDEQAAEAAEVVKLLDFGIAKVEDSSTTNTGLTGTGEIVGTATYMAPELVLGAVAGVSSEIYSLGIMAYELLTGTPPFRGKNPYEVLRCHIEDTPVPPRTRAPDLPAALEAVVLRAIAKQPEDRFASMAEL